MVWLPDKYFKLKTHPVACAGFWKGGGQEQARSQDLEKGGGLFWKSEKCANDLDSNFHWPWISFRRFVQNLRWNVSERSEIESFFRPKLDDLQKKKKKKRSSPKFRVIFWPKSKIQTFFPPKIGWSPKKKKKVFAKLQSDFSAEIQNSNVFSAQNWVISKKKKKGLRQNSGRFFFQFCKFKRTRGLFSYGGGYFPFSTENRPQKHKKHAILHTSQANGGARAPPAPPGYATACLPVPGLCFPFSFPNGSWLSFNAYCLIAAPLWTTARPFSHFFAF